jgi:hypothetical protein
VGASASLNNASANSHGVLASQLARIRKADLFRKQAEEILELGQDALCLHLTWECDSSCPK